MGARRESWQIVVHMTLPSPRIPSRPTRVGLAFVILGCVLSAASCSGKPTPTVAFGSGLQKVSAPPEVLAQEHAMHRRLNRDRADRGLPPLEYDERLADLGRYHSADMRDHSFFAHESPTSGSLADRLDAAGYLALAARENLSEAPDVEAGQDGLLKSPGHYANIMADDITHVGIGIVRGGVHQPSNLTITQVFARPGRLETAPQAEQSILRALRQARSQRGLPEARSSALLTELARKQVARLATSEAELDQVADEVTAEVSRRREPNLKGVLVGAQRILQSSEVELPGPLLQERSVSYGVAAQATKDESGRPRLQVLLLVGL